MNRTQQPPSRLTSLPNRLIWIALLLSGDLFSKHLLKSISPPLQLNLIPHLLDLTYTFNTGLSFSLLQNLPDSLRLPLISGVSILAISWFAFIWFHGRNQMHPLSDWGFVCILGGGLGNFVERIRLGGVTDFFHFRIGSYSLFVNNLADIVISCGVVLLALGWWQDIRRAQEKQLGNNQT